MAARKKNHGIDYWKSVKAKKKIPNPFRPQHGPAARQMDELERATQATSKPKAKPPKTVDPIDAFVYKQRAERKRRAARKKAGK